MAFRAKSSNMYSSKFRAVPHTPCLDTHVSILTEYNVVPGPEHVLNFPVSLSGIQASKSAVLALHRDVIPIDCVRCTKMEMNKLYKSLRES